MTIQTRRNFMTTVIAGIATLPAAASFGATTGARTHVVDIRKHAFVPDKLTIKAGDSVRFVNRDFAPHTVTSDKGKFDSGSLMMNGTTQLKFPKAGEFPYSCTVHKTMHGRISVV